MHWRKYIHGLRQQNKHIRKLSAKDIVKYTHYFLANETFVPAWKSFATISSNGRLLKRFLFFKSRPLEFDYTEPIFGQFSKERELEISYARSMK